MTGADASSRSIAELNLVLMQPNAVSLRRKDILSLANAFLVANAHLETSPNLKEPHADPLQPIFKFLASEDGDGSSALDVHTRVLKVCKVLFRKHANRCNVGKAEALTVIDLLKKTPSTESVCEAANVVLNMCFDKRNVDLFLQLQVQEALRPLLESEEAARQASSLGALQSLCFEHEGRQALRDCGFVPVVVGLLTSPNNRVQTRALGTVHNMSSDAQSISIIRQSGAVPPLVSLLRSPCPELCGSAAGTIQNLSREAACREVLLEHGAVEPLSDLLVGTDVASQISAAGALLNLVGPDVGGEEQALFHGLLADGLVLGALDSCMGERG